MYSYCDACRAPLGSRVQTVQIQSGEPIRMTNGREHMKLDRPPQLLIFCERCGEYASAVLGHLASNGPPRVAAG